MSDTKQIVMVTGCSYGLGCSIAMAFASDKDEAYKVWATVRISDEKDKMIEMAGQLHNQTLFIHELDLCEQASIESVVNHILTEDGRIDILVNNAAIITIGALESFDFKKGRQLMEVNFFGHCRLIQLLLPEMKEKKRGRIINISSIATVASPPFSEFYVASKIALEGFSESLSSTVRPFNVWISNIQPTPIKTDHAVNTFITGNFEDDVERDNIDDATGTMLDAWLANMKTHMTSDNAQSPQEVADFVKEVAEIHEPSFRYQSSSMGRHVASACYSDPKGDNTIKDYMNVITSSQ